VIPLDIDEVIVPVKDKKWTQLIKRIISNDPKVLQKYASLSAPNVFFFNLDSNNSVYRNNALMLNNVQRLNTFSKPGLAVKSFISVNTSLAIFNHYSLFPLYPKMKKNALIHHSLAQLNHYRSNCPHRSKVCKQLTKGFKNDKILKKYQSPLLARIKKVEESLNLTLLDNESKSE